MHKKGVMWSAVVYVILGLVVIALVGNGIMKPTLMYAKSKFFTRDGKFVFPWEDVSDEFVPFVPAYSSDDLTAEASMRGLAKAVNAVATGSEVYSQNDRAKDIKDRIESYEVKYYITYEYQDDSLEYDYDKEMSATEKPANIIYPHDFWTHVFTSKKEAERTEKRLLLFSDTMRDVKQIKSVHNMELSVKYVDGTTCTATTVENGKKYSGVNLDSWGGRDSKTNELLDGPDEDKEPDKGCSDSMTYVQCPYIKAYYCGRRGSPTDKDGNMVHWEPGGTTSKIKTMVEISKTLTEADARATRDSITKRIMQRGKEALDALSKTLSVSPTKGRSQEKSTSQPGAYCEGGEKMLNAEGTLTDVTVKCEDSGNICYVCNFEIPQQDTDEWWIKGFGDPQYLAYYEQMPQEPTAYWQFATLKAAGTVGATMVVAGGINFITSKIGVKVKAKQVDEVLSEGIERLGKELGEELAEKVLKESAESMLTGLAEKAGQDGVKSVVKAGLFRQALNNFDTGIQMSASQSRYISEIYETYLKEAAESYVTTAAKSTSQIAKEIEEQAVERFTKNLDDIFMNPGKHGGDPTLFESSLLDQFGRPIMTGESASVIYKEAVEASLKKSVAEEVSEATMRRFMADLSTTNAFKNLLEEGAEQFSKKAVFEALDKSHELFQALNKLPKAQQKAIMNEANDRLARMFTKNGEFYTGSIMKKTADEFGMSIDDAISAFPESKLQYMGTFIKNIYGGTADVARQTLGTVPTSGWVSGPFMPVKFSLNPFVAATGTLKKSAQFVYGKRYTAMLAITLLGAYNDAVNLKFTPGGYNTLLLGTPSVMGNERLSFALDPAVATYYVALHNKYLDENRLDKIIDTERFYMVSPCKISFRISKSNCDCYRVPEYQHFNFGGGPIDVQKGTIRIQPGTPDNIVTPLAKLLGEGMPDGELKDNDLISQYDGYLDYSKAVKACEDRGSWDAVKSLFGSEQSVNYETSCIIVKPVIDMTIDDNYCFARFPTSDSIKRYVSAGALVTEIAVEALSVGLATPIAITIGAADIAFSGFVTEIWQKWPRSEKG